MVIQPNTNIAEDDVVEDILKKDDRPPIVKGNGIGKVISPSSLPLTMRSNAAVLKKYKFKVKRSEQNRKIAAVSDMNFEEPIVDIAEVVDFLQLQRETLVAAKIAAVRAKRETELAAVKEKRVITTTTVTAPIHPKPAKNSYVSDSTKTSRSPLQVVREGNSEKPRFPSMMIDSAVRSAEEGVVNNTSLKAVLDDSQDNNNSSTDNVIVYHEEELDDSSDDKPVDDEPEDNMGAYRGDSIYRELLVIENMELYFREQIIRPGQLPYLHTTTDSAPDKSKHVVNERYVTLFTEKIIPFDTNSRDQRQRSASLGNYESFSPKRGSTEPQIPDTKVTRHRRQSGTGAKLDIDNRASSSVLLDTDIYGPCSPPETKVLIVLTDVNVYIVDYSSVEEPSLTFSDAPMPLLISEHPIVRFFSCTTFFGSHRFMLSFTPEDPVVTMMGSSSSSSSDNTDDLNPSVRVEDANPSQAHEYMVLTRDKTRTFSIITRLTHIANAARQQLSSLAIKERLAGIDGDSVRLPNVKMRNHDTPFLEAFQNISISIVE
eukprot:gene36556-49258_t